MKSFIYQYRFRSYLEQGRELMRLEKVVDHTELGCRYYSTEGRRNSPLPARLREVDLLAQAG